jgi:zinc protease
VETQLRPDRATRVIVGDVSPEEALAKADAELGGWSAPRVEPRPAPAPAPAGEQQVVVVDRPGARLALVLVGLRLPGGEARDDPAAEAVSWRLDSTLMASLRVDAGVTYGVHVLPETLSQARALVVQTAVDGVVAGETVGRLLAAVETLAQVPLPEEAMDRARWQVARRHARRFDTVALASEALERLALEGLPADHYERQAASIAALDAARVQALAKRLVGREVVVVVGDAKALLPQLKDAGFDAALAKP